MAGLWYACRVNPPSDNQRSNSVDSGPPIEIRCENIRKSFGSRVVLSGVDLVIRRGEMVAIVGGSGCGKTVLLEHMFAAMWPDEPPTIDDDGKEESKASAGEVDDDGHESVAAAWSGPPSRVWIADHSRPYTPLVDLGELDDDGLDRVRAHWAVVFQRNALFSGTVEENVALWLREVARLDDKTIEQRVHDALVSVGLDPEKERGKHRDVLSGGMAKRVAVARAIAMRPSIVFYDEPTTGLDPKHAAMIHDLILSTHNSPGGDGLARTSVIVTHDMMLLRRLRPRVVMLHEGRVFFDGPYGDFEKSESPIIRPYVEHMPMLHERVVLDNKQSR